MVAAVAFSLFLLALVLPIMGALVLRLLAARLSSSQISIVAIVFFGCASISALVLAQNNVASVQLGTISILLPINSTAADLPALPAAQSATGQSIAAAPAQTSRVVTDTQVLASAVSEATGVPTVATPSRTPTVVTPSTIPTSTASPTSAPPPTPSPTATATPTAVPTAAPTAAPARQRTYTVQSGDTLRSIA